MEFGMPNWLKFGPQISPDTHYSPRYSTSKNCQNVPWSTCCYIGVVRRKSTRDTNYGLFGFLKRSINYYGNTLEGKLNILYPLCPKFPQVISIFQKDCDGKVGNSLFFRKETYASLRVSGAGAGASAVGNVWLVTLTKACPTHKRSQHSHSFSPYRCMIHGWVFCRALIGSRTHTHTHTH